MKIGKIRINLSSRNAFVIKFSLLTLSLFTIFFFLREKLTFLLNFTAYLLSKILYLFGIKSSVSGNVLIFSNINFSIIYECTAIFSIIIFTSGVLSYPSKFRKKFCGVFWGVIVIYVLNIVRLIILAEVGIKYPLAFKVVHSFLWESLFLILVILVFILWIRWSRAKE